MRRHPRLAPLTVIVTLWLSAGAIPSPAGEIETDFIQQPWPKQWVRELEVGRYPVRWRQRASDTDGIFAGVRFTVPLSRATAWELGNDYQDLGEMTPGITAVRYLEQSEHRQVVQVDMRVLWKSLQLTFEVERDPPDAIRFRLLNDMIGEYRGLCLFEESSGPEPATVIELATWLKPAQPVPNGFILLAERITMLQGARKFLEMADRHRQTLPAR